MDGRHIRGLDGLRAVAIALVIVGHAADVGGGEALHRAIGSWSVGAYGVAIFFALSGYLITTLLLREQRIDLMAFYRRRAFRILPAAAVYLLAVAPFVPWRDVWTSLLFVHNWESGGSVLAAHYWSLSVEEQFYLLWPTALLLTPKRRSLLLTLVVWLAMLPAWVHWTYVAKSSGILGNSTRSDLQCGPLAAGCALALCRSRVSVRLALFVFWSGALAISASASLGSGHGRAILASYVLNGGLAAVVLGAASGGAPWLDAKPLRWLGRLSYSLYLWQQPWLRYAPLARWPWGLVPAITCAALSYYVVERPMLRVRDRSQANVK